MKKKNTIFIWASTIIGVIIGAIFLDKQNVSTDKGKLVDNSPSNFSFKTWKEALLQAKDAFTNVNTPILAAGIAYFGTLAFFPLMIAAVGLAGLIIEPAQVQSIADSIAKILPNDIASLITSQLESTTNNQNSSFIALIVGILIAIFSVSGAVDNMIKALNVSYELEENRSFVKLKLTSFSLTALAIIAGVIILPIIFLGGDILTKFGLPEMFVQTFSILKWLALPLSAVIGLSILYKFGPDHRNDPPLQWLSWGAAIATVVWLIVSIVFSVYLQYFANFSQSYSIFAGIIGLMMWLNLSSTIILAGAQINGKLEAQARQAAN